MQLSTGGVGLRTLAHNVTPTEPLTLLTVKASMCIDIELSLGYRAIWS